MFSDEVYALVIQVPEGAVSSYGELARALGNAKASRAVGRILGKNPDLVTVPCHRIICSDGRIGGYALGVAGKTRLLRREGVKVCRGKVTEYEKIFFRDFKRP